MTLVTASIDIDAPRAKVFETMLDPARLDEWVTIHRKVNDADGGRLHEGYAMEQTLCLRGANFKVKWTLTEFEPDVSATKTMSFGVFFASFAPAPGDAMSMKYPSPPLPPSLLR